MALALFLFGPVQAIGGAYHIEDLRIPMPEAGKQGLEALLVRPEGPPGKFPLVILSHGSPRKADVRMNMTARNMQPLAMEFARRGWAAVAVLRRGYGGSGRAPQTSLFHHRLGPARAEGVAHRHG